MGPTVPGIDAGTRQRLTARFGSEVEAWFDELSGVLTALAKRWQFELGSPIPRGSVSAVFRCRMADGRGAVLKASPDRARLAFEAAALGAWPTVHTPAVIALDGQLGETAPAHASRLSCSSLRRRKRPRRSIPRSVVVGHERAQDWLAGSVVVPDRGGQGQDALQNADDDTLGRVPAVPFEVQLAFECLVDRLDDLA